MKPRLEKLVLKAERRTEAIRKEKELRERALKNNICPVCGSPTTKTSKDMTGWFSGGERGEVTRIIDTCPNGHIHIKKHFGCFD
jgi:hypothetical protein